MLAYLWERHPDLVERWLRILPGLVAPAGEWSIATQVVEPGIGRFDMTLEQPGEAFLVIESKLEAELTSEQLGRYVDHVVPRAEPLRAVVSLTRHPPAPAPELLQRAAAGGVRLIAARWQELAQVIADPFEDGEAGDFVRMLIEEGLVVPQAITTEDLAVWNRGAAVLTRIKVLLTEARPAIVQISPGLKPNNRWGSDDRWIYSGYSSERLEIGVGFSANESAKHPASDPIVWTYLRNRELADADISRRSAEARRAVLGAAQPWPGYVSLHRRAAEVLRASDFRDQTREVVQFAFSVAEEFQRVGYLPADLPLRPPGAA